MKLNFAGHDFILDGSGALYWPLHQMLVIADAHLEKSSFFARRGFHLPPYDSHITLDKLLKACERLSVQKILILGDFFHDNDAHHRLSAESLRLFETLRKFPIIWIKGNHDIGYQPQGIKVYDEFRTNGIVFRHEALQDGEKEISGHFHPKIEFIYKGKFFRERCFLEDGKKLMLPAFGAYTGGLSIKEKAIYQLFSKSCRPYVIINDTVIAAPS